jgi:glycosyltransferase involved in cell wall biosynthesis
MAAITAIVLTLNEAAHIGDCLATLEWAERLLVLDSFSSDATCELARQAGAEVVQSRFENYAQQRNVALDAAGEAAWIFFVDADERCTPELSAEIRHVTAHRPENGWYVPRHNYIFGKLTLGAGWYPDYQLRLLRGGHARYERPVHELAVVAGEVGWLQQPLIHYNYDDKADFHARQRRYSAVEARILHEQGIPTRPWTSLTMPLRQFWWRFVTLHGWRDGRHGLWLSGAMAWYEWKKYSQLARIRASSSDI